MSRTIALALLATAACISHKDYDPAACSDPSEHDEDGDCLADKIDLCPMVPGATQADDDEDGVGDECDPQPLGENDFTFLGFGGGDGESRWDSDGDATWVVSGDALEVDLRDGRTGGATWFGIGSSPSLVIAQLRVDQAGPKPEVSLFANYSSKYGNGSECYVLLSSGVLVSTLVVYGERDPFQSETVAMPEPPADVSESFRLQAARGYSFSSDTFLGHRCTYAPSGAAEVEVSRDDARGGVGIEVRFAAHDVHLRVEWMVAYHIDPSEPLQPPPLP